MNNSIFEQWLDKSQKAFRGLTKGVCSRIKTNELLTSILFCSFLFLYPGNTIAKPIGYTKSIPAKKATGNSKSFILENNFPVVLDQFNGGRLGFPNTIFLTTQNILLVPIAKQNICPATTVNLLTQTTLTGTAPAGTTISWHSGTPATTANEITTPTAVGAGIYFATFKDATNNCYSPTSTPIEVTIITCPTVSPIQKTNICPATTVDLIAQTTLSGTAPLGTTISWHSGTPATTANEITTPTAVAAGIYYPAFKDAINNCYSPTGTPIQVTINICPPVVGTPIAKSNICPATTVNLLTQTSLTGTAPSGTTVSWHSGTPATTANEIATPTAVAAGTYYPAFKDAVNNCYSPTGTPILVTINACTVLAPDLTTTIGQPSPALTQGVTSNLPVIVANIGTAPTTASPITTTVTLPTGITAPAMFTNGAWSCSTLASIVTCTTAGPIANGASNAFNIPITPNSLAVGTTPVFNGTTVPTTGETITNNNAATPLTVPSAVTAATAIAKSNICPTTTVNLVTQTTLTGTAPSGTTVSWHSGTPATTANEIATPSAVIAGTYYPAFKDAVNNCYSPTGTPILVTINACTVLAPDLTTTIGQPSPVLTQGVTSNLPVTVANIGTAPTTASPITTSVTLPPGITAPAMFTNGAWSCNTVGSLVTCTTAGPIANGASSAFNISITPNSLAVGTTPVFNGTTLPTTGETVTNNNAATPLVPTTPVAAIPDLVTTISQPTTPLSVGVLSNVQVTVANVGNAPATGTISTTVTLPTGVSTPTSFVSNGWSCNTVVTTVNCSIAGPLSFGGSSNFNLPVTPIVASVNTSPVFSATTTPSLNEIVTTNNTATMTPTAAVTAPDLTMSIGQPTPALVANQTSNLPVTISNVGTAPASGPLSATINLPAGVTAPSTFISNGWSCGTIGLVVNCSNSSPLTNGNSTTFNVPITPNASTVGTSPVFNGSVSPTFGEGITTNNAATPTTTSSPVTAAPAPDLITSIGLPLTPLVVNTTSNIPVTVTNIGSASTTGIVTTSMTLPSGVTAPPVFVSNGWICNTLVATVTCTTTNPIASAGTTTFNVPVTPTAPTAGTSPTFTATTSPAIGEIVTGNNAATPMIPTVPVQDTPAPDMAISVSPITTQMAVGTATNISINIDNVGTAANTGNLTTVLTLPTGMTAPASFVNNGWSCNTLGSQVTCINITPLAPGNSKTLTIPVTPTAASVGTTPAFAITVNPVMGEVITTNNSTSVTPTLPILGFPDLTTTVGQPTTPLTIGSPSNIPVTVANIGSGITTGPITTTITLPVGTSAPASFTSNGWSCTTVAQLVSCSTPTLMPAGGSSVINVPVTPAASTVGSPLTFAATTLPVASESNTTNNTSPPMTTPNVGGLPDLTTTIGQPPTPFQVGVPSNVPMTVANIGNAPATGPITSTMTLPTGMSAPASFTDGPWTCTTVGSTVSCTSLVSIPNGGSSTINVPVTPAPSTVGTTPTFTGTTNPVSGETVITNNPATPIVPTQAVLGLPDLTVSIGQPSPALVVSQVSNIPVTVTNIGNAPATGILTFTTTLPSSLTAPASFNAGNGWSCTTVGQLVSCSNPNTSSLPATIGSNNSIFNIPVTPIAGSAGQTPAISGSLASVPNEAVTTNNAATPVLTSPILALATPDLALSYGAASPALTVGVLSTIPVIITNVGTATATGQLVFSLNIPSNTSSPAFYNAGNGWTCNASLAVLTCLNLNASGLAATVASTFNIQLTPNANTAGQSVILNGNVNAVSGEVILVNNSNVLLIPTPIAAAGSGTVTLSIKAMLQGALIGSSGGLMRDDLRTKNVIPLIQPYTLANGFTQIAGGGLETVVAIVLTTAGNNAIVDWVMVELRNAASPSTVVATRSALIQRDGDIVDVDGVSPLTFSNAAVTSGSQYYVAVRHRNHLAVMTAAAITVTSATPLVDFTTNATANYQYPVGDLRRSSVPQITQSGVQAMWAGNATGDNKVVFQGPSNDPDAVFFDVLGDSNNTGSLVNFIRNNVYSKSDIDMNGRVIFQGPSNEVDVIFFETFGHPDNINQIINFIIWQQLP